MKYAQCHELLVERMTVQTNTFRFIKLFGRENRETNINTNG
jgi:hypothetical protein